MAGILVLFQGFGCLAGVFCRCRADFGRSYGVIAAHRRMLKAMAAMVI